MLPPLQAALEFKIKRSHFVSEVFRNGDKAVSSIIDPKNFDWKMKDNLYETVLTDLAPLRNIDAELSFCSGQTNCRSICFKCKKNNLRRIESCSCINCENGTEHLDVFKARI